jgi:hypothetical protein
VLIEADQLVEPLTGHGQVDVDAFRATLEPLIEPGKKLRIYGEVVSLLAARGAARPSHPCVGRRHVPRPLTACARDAQPRDALIRFRSASRARRHPLAAQP